ncbi:MAG: hypothetical protein A3G33_08125 [Omnitrophica bacterium RIFCSPLOWO2_12_FULL_44_17]|uniref:Uncharacterized protein n=1 Tax=Candidatus Danuiimicrobium aquiferis TaxID=1801832 RepID=A0A1G1KYQ5_9BACT|nr:MAG: hypothetical protein A3B72_05825 [Omnitrophica bacterium RIFCSPHIGHO2_02_FULL_45_28]OGW97769.1 MAG: hypothetical protein A3G33_08125 [Omnitrophica bacterium RIFCSPLOWO2_12_FULL_44_17]
MSGGERDLSIRLLLSDKEGLSRLNAALHQIESQTKKSADSMNLSWAGLASKVYLLEKALRPVVDFMKSAIKESAAQEDAINRLNVALQLQGTFTQELSLQYQEMAASIQSSTRFADDAVLRMMQTLTTVGNVAPQDMGKVTQAVLNFATVTGTDLQTAAEQFAKAADGDTKMLEKWIGKIDESIPRSHRFAVALGMVDEKMGGAASANVHTYSGAVAQLGNSFHDLQKSLGNYIVQNPTIVQGINNVTWAFNNLSKFVTEHKTDIDNFLSGVGFDSQVAVLAVEEFALAVSVGINKIYATGWKGLQSFLLSGPAGAAAGMVAAAGAETTDPIVAQLEQQLQAIMAKKDELLAAGPSLGTQALAPDPAAIQTALNQSLPLIQQFAASARTSVSSFTDGFADGFGHIDTSANAFFASFGRGMGAATKQATSMFADTMTQVILGQKKVDEAFKELGASILSVFLKMAIELAAQQALALIAQKFIGGAVATTMSGIGAAAAVPAALVSLATFGTNAVAASAGIASTTALAVGLAAGSAAGSIPGAEEGGTVRRSGLTLVGESGPEILSLPRAAQITPLDRASGGMNNYFSINVEINAQGVISKEDLGNYIVQVAGSKLSEFIAVELSRL